MIALILPNCGTVTLRDDGSVVFLNRDRCQHVIDAMVVDAIGRLLQTKEDYARTKAGADTLEVGSRG